MTTETTIAEVPPSELAVPVATAVRADAVPDTCLLEPHSAGVTIPAGEWHVVQEGGVKEGTANRSTLPCARNVTAPVATVGVVTAPAQTLPSTGGETIAIGFVAAVILVAGLALWLVARRPHPTASSAAACAVMASRA